MKAKLWIRLFRSFVKNCTTKNSDGNDTLTVGVVNVTKFCDQVEIEIQQLESANARLRKAIEEADFHPEYCATVFKEPCDCGFEQWKRNALWGNSETP